MVTTEETVTVMTARQRDVEWCRENREALMAARAEKEAAERAWILQTEKKLRAKFAAREAAAPAAATAGPGWRLRNGPHHDLEKFARNVWDFAFHGAPWLENWKVRWADLDGGAIGMCG